MNKCMIWKIALIILLVMGWMHMRAMKQAGCVTREGQACPTF